MICFYIFLRCFFASLPRLLRLPSIRPLLALRRSDKCFFFLFLPTIFRLILVLFCCYVVSHLSLLPPKVPLPVVILLFHTPASPNPFLSTTGYPLIHSPTSPPLLDTPHIYPTPHPSFLTSPHVEKRPHYDQPQLTSTVTPDPLNLLVFFTIPFLLYLTPPTHCHELLLHVTPTHPSCHPLFHPNKILPTRLQEVACPHPHTLQRPTCSSYYLE